MNNCGTRFVVAGVMGASCAARIRGSSCTFCAKSAVARIGRAATQPAARLGAVRCHVALKPADATPAARRGRRTARPSVWGSQRVCAVAAPQRGGAAATRAHVACVRAGGLLGGAFGLFMGAFELVSHAVAQRRSRRPRHATPRALPRSHGAAQHGLAATTSRALTRRCAARPIDAVSGVRASRPPRGRTGRRSRGATWRATPRATHAPRAGARQRVHMPSACASARCESSRLHTVGACVRRSYTKGFSQMGSIYSASECVVEKVRGEGSVRRGAAPRVPRLTTVRVVPARALANAGEGAARQRQQRRSGLLHRRLPGACRCVRCRAAPNGLCVCRRGAVTDTVVRAQRGGRARWAAARRLQRSACSWTSCSTTDGSRIAGCCCVLRALSFTWSGGALVIIVVSDGRGILRPCCLR